MVWAFVASSSHLNAQFDTQSLPSSLRISLIAITKAAALQAEKHLLEVVEICSKVRSTLSKTQGERKRRIPITDYVFSANFITDLALWPSLFLVPFHRDNLVNRGTKQQHCRAKNRRSRRTLEEGRRNLCGGNWVRYRVELRSVMLKLLNVLSFIYGKCF